MLSNAFRDGQTDISAVILQVTAVTLLLTVCVFSAGSDDTGAVDSSLDFLKESFHMAGSYNWSGVDLTQFPGKVLILAHDYAK